MTTTALLITTVVIVLGIYDLCAVIFGKLSGKGIKYSISRFMQGLPRQATFFVCVVFYVMGHFWGFMNCPDCPKCDCSEAGQNIQIQPKPQPAGLEE